MRHDKYIIANNMDTPNEHYFDITYQDFEQTEILFLQIY